MYVYSNFSIYKLWKGKLKNFIATCTEGCTEHSYKNIIVWLTFMLTTWFHQFKVVE